METVYRIVAWLTAILVSITATLTGGKTEEKKTDFQQCKNVIYIIGDGMGFNTIKMAEQYLARELTAFDDFTLEGEGKTASASSSVIATDSAAGGTALATGVRISLDSVGVYPSDIDAQVSYPMNLTELAISLGKAAGIVTTAKTYDATPAAFSAHTSYRKNYEDIHRQQSDSALTLLWGQIDEYNDLEYTASKGFTVISSIDEMNSISETGRSFGQFYGDFFIDGSVEGMPTLSEMTAKAIDRLDNDEDGFFLMIEGAHIDKCSDDKNKEGASYAVAGLEKAIRVALDYARAKGDTMVVVTADHETGGIIELSGKYVYTTTMHTNKNVPLLVYGCDDFIVNGEVIENREIARRTACVMGETNFPTAITVS